MKFVELKKHIKNDELYCCYNFYGDDSFLINSSQNFFFDFVSTDELSKTILSAEDFDIKNLNSILSTSSFFGGKKVVLIKNIDEAKEKQIQSQILSNLPCLEMGNILILSSQNPLFEEKKLHSINVEKKLICEVDCNRLDKAVLYQWINSSLTQKNAKMEEGAKKLLVDYTNGYLSRIALELDKLVSYKLGEEITQKDIELLVQKELEYSVFELTESLGVQNREKALKILDDMMSDKKMYQSVFSLIQNHFKRMFFSAITPKTNLQIADMLGVKEFAVKKAKIQAQNFSKIALKNIISMCADLDYKIKTSQIDYKNAVYFLVYNILSNKK